MAKTNMTSLRQKFLVDKLKQAAESKNSVHLSLIREIIKRIKMIQLKHVEVATDRMVLDVLEKLHSQKEEELQLLHDFLAFAHKNKKED